MADPLSAASESREIRVFLSSTFRDFNEERKLLATQVFPELNRRARERGMELVEVDLRWGVTQEQAEDGHALEICLQEIERCRRYFIGMLGRLLRQPHPARAPIAAGGSGAAGAAAVAQRQDRPGQLHRAGDRTAAAADGRQRH